MGVASGYSILCRQTVITPEITKRSGEHQTTYLSSNLIECAILGQADQRLINASDGMMTAEKCDLAWLDGLLTWGSSSGLDAFAGMILANDCRIGKV